jgi:hypothetical protein
MNPGPHITSVELGTMGHEGKYVILKKESELK